MCILLTLLPRIFRTTVHIFQLNHFIENRVKEKYRRIIYTHA